MFGDMTIFEGTGRRTTKVNIALSAGNGLPNTIFKFLFQRTSYWLNESQKTNFGPHFPLYQRFWGHDHF